MSYMLEFNAWEIEDENIEDFHEKYRIHSLSKEKFKKKRIFAPTIVEIDGEVNKWSDCRFSIAKDYAVEKKYDITYHEWELAADDMNLLGKEKPADEFGDITLQLPYVIIKSDQYGYRQILVFKTIEEGQNFIDNASSIIDQFYLDFGGAKMLDIIKKKDSLED